MSTNLVFHDSLDFVPSVGSWVGQPPMLEQTVYWEKKETDRGKDSQIISSLGQAYSIYSPVHLHYQLPWCINDLYVLVKRVCTKHHGPQQHPATSKKEVGEREKESILYVRSR